MIKKNIVLTVVRFCLLTGMVGTFSSFVPRNEEIPVWITCGKCGERYLSTDYHKCR